MEKPGLLQSMGCQRVGHDFGTEQQSFLSLWLCLRIKLTWNGLTGEKHANLLTFKYLWKWKSWSCVQLFVSPYSLWNSPGQNTGVDSLSILQGIFPTQRSNPRFPHCKWILYQLSHKGSLRILVSLSLLQGIFPTQESNWGLLHCRQILYQLSYEGSPKV